jgi:WD40 repeat protein
VRTVACRTILLLCGITCCCFFPRAAIAIGWDSDDFLISGGPNFTTRIGVFDHDLTFKGDLDSGFATVAGLDFDHLGHLVAVGPLSAQQVRVYDSSGVRIGGFTRSDGLLGGAFDLKVAPDGSYVIGVGDGVRRFLPDGTFVQQIGSGPLRAVAIVPGDRVWAGGIGTGFITAFDLGSGAQVGTISIPGTSSFRSLIYSAASNTVLATDGASVFELDLQGDLLRTFNVISNGLYSVTRGPDGDVFATTGSSQRVLHWSASGNFLGSITTPEDFGVVGIVWTGNAPEPTCGLMTLTGAFVLLKRRDRYFI